MVKLMISAYTIGHFQQLRYRNFIIKQLLLAYNLSLLLPNQATIILAWSTESEIDNDGFNIYRSKTEGGEYIKINSSIIPAQGSATQGASYEYVDTDVQNRKTYYYNWRIQILSGNITTHGPVCAMPRLIYGMGK